MYKYLIYKIKDKIAYVIVNRPQAMNALNLELLDEIYNVFTRIDLDEGVAITILTGEGRAFVSGADITELRGLTPVEGRRMSIKGQKVMNLIENSEKTVIAAINGVALGGGCELAMACDIRIASEKAKFGHPEVNLGIIPGFGGTQRLSRLVGKGMAKYLMMSAETIPADEALRVGLVERVVPAEELIGVTIKLAKTIISKAPIAVHAIKSTVNAGFNLDMPTATALETEAFTGPFSSKDRDEGMSAFFEKRVPEFKNK